MSSILSLLQTPEEPTPVPVPTSPRQLQDNARNGGQLLELRSETGAVYIQPKGWQRIRLRWAFRHFRQLPPQLLSRGDRRLIEKLSRSAAVATVLPMPRASVFGVVEKVAPTKMASAPSSANRVVTLKTGLAATPASPAKSGIAEFPLPVPQTATRKTQGPPIQWGALGALAAVGLLVIVAKTYGSFRFPGADQRPHPVPAATSAISVPPATTLSLNVVEPQRWIAPLPPESLPVRQELATVAAPANPRPSARTPKTGEAAGSPVLSEIPTPAKIPDVPADSIAALVPAAAPAPVARRLVFELPQGSFARPVVSEPNLVGDLHLKALIGTDGSVKEVTVESGSPKLAEAGMRAVRQWHYRPFQVQGSPVEMETHIKMSFFGQDAISIGSVANEPASQLR